MDLLNQIALVLAHILLFGCLIVAVRMIFINRSRLAGIEAVYKYSKRLLDYDRYDSRINYYKKMLYSMEQTMFLRFWDFSKMACVKPEYKELLEPYFYE